METTTTTNFRNEGREELATSRGWKQQLNAINDFWCDADSHVGIFRATGRASAPEHAVTAMHAVLTRKTWPKSGNHGSQHPEPPVVLLSTEQPNRTGSTDPVEGMFKITQATATNLDFILNLGQHVFSSFYSVIPSAENMPAFTNGVISAMEERLLYIGGAGSGNPKVLCLVDIDAAFKDEGTVQPGRLIRILEYICKVKGNGKIIFFTGSGDCKAVEQLYNSHGVKEICHDVRDE